MLTFLIVILTIVLVADCFLLGLLVLIQLPKKEAGLGVAFGGGAADALFGAGSGNALTKLTKYSAGAFFGLVIVLSMLQVHQNGSSSGSALRKALENMPANAPMTPAPASSGEQPPAATTTPAATNTQPMLFTPVTNAPAASNPPAK